MLEERENRYVLPRLVDDLLVGFSVNIECDHETGQTHIDKNGFSLSDTISGLEQLDEEKKLKGLGGIDSCSFSSSICDIDEIGATPSAGSDNVSLSQLEVQHSNYLGSRIISGLDGNTRSYNSTSNLEFLHLTEKFMEKLNVGNKLFSLQVFVDNIKIAGKGSLQNIAMAFRFMDFPTLLIIPTSRERFDKGKSCFFYLPYADIAGKLRSTQLHLMLVESGIKDAGLKTDLDHGPKYMRLIGSTKIDASSFCGVEFEDKTFLNFPSPKSKWGWKRGLFSMTNSLGERVATTIVRVRLCHIIDDFIPCVIDRSAVCRTTRNTFEPEIQERIFNELSERRHIRQSIENLVTKVEWLEQKLKFNRIAPARQSPNLKFPLHSQDFKNKVSNQCNWMPTPGFSQTAVQPPAMFFKNEASTGEGKINDEGKNPRKSKTKSILRGSSTIKEKSIAEGRNLSRFRRAKRTPYIFPCVAGLSKNNEIRSPNKPGDFIENSHVNSSGDLNVLRIRMTRAQTIRAQAIRSKYLQSHEGKQSVKHVKKTGTSNRIIS